MGRHGILRLRRPHGKQLTSSNCFGALTDRAPRSDLDVDRLRLPPPSAAPPRSELGSQLCTNLKSQ